MKKTKTLVTISLLIALTFVLARFLAIPTQLARISLEFLPISLAGAIFGPILGGVTALLADLLGSTLVPSGPFFIGFSISATISGLIYGFFLYKKEVSFLRIILCVLTKVIIVDLLLVSLWLFLLYKTDIRVLMSTRIIKCIILLPVETLLIKYLVIPIKKHFFSGKI